MDANFQFAQRKRSGIQAISECQLDKSPKGSVDEPIIDLVKIINEHDDYCTTSSCSGRISLFHTNGLQVTSKGSGNWLLALHRKLTNETELEQALVSGLASLPPTMSLNSITLFKHEPFVLHVLCRTVACAQTLLQLARESGFRESGISVSNENKIILGVRTSSNVLELPVALNGQVMCTNEYLRFISHQANVRFDENAKRIQHFHQALNRFLFPSHSLSLPTEKMLEWQHVEETSRFKRWAHVCVPLDNSRILLFGGWTDDAKRTNESVIYNAEDASFRALTDKNCPEALVYHTGNRVSSNDVLVFGGRTSPSAPSNDLWQFDIANENWQQVQTKVGPCARWRHAACSDGISGKLFVHGGRSGEDTVLDDLWEFDGKEWVEWPNLASALGKRFAHAMVATSTNLFIHGGLASVDGLPTDGEIHIVDVETKTWLKRVDVNIPWRFSHSWVVNFDNLDESYLCGGVTNKTEANVLGLEEAFLVNLSSLDTTRLILSCSKQQGVELLAVQHAICVLNSKTIVVFGGGATCFAFGSVFSPCAQLLNVKVSPNMENPNNLYCKCSKQHAVEVKKVLATTNALDKSRKVEHAQGGDLCFPVLFPVDLANTNMISLTPETKPVAPTKPILSALAQEIGLPLYPFLVLRACCD
jgi:tRNA wybutosine-synthesizing protein 3